MAGDDYTIADMAIWPWYGTLVKGLLYEAGVFLRRAGLHQRHALDRRDRAAPGRQARPHGQPRLRRPGQPAARAPRRERLRHPHAGQAGARNDHALRLRHRAEPAPRAHPAGREGRRARHRAGRPAHRRADGRGLSADQSALHRARAAHRRRPAADRQRRDRRVARGALSRAAAAGHHAGGKGRGRELELAHRVRGPAGDRRGAAQRLARDGQPRAARAGRLRADPRARGTRARAGAAFFADAERAAGRPRLHRDAIASASPTSTRSWRSTSRASSRSSRATSIRTCSAGARRWGSGRRWRSDQPVILRAG